MYFDDLSNQYILLDIEGNSASKIEERKITQFAALVIQNNTIPTGTHSAVHAEGGGSVLRQTAVVSVIACRSRARRKTSGSSLPRAEALRRIPRQAF